MRHCEEAKPTWQSVFPNRESACCARHFDFLHKPNPNVPLYADGFGLFVLSAPLTSVSLSKNKFFDRLLRSKTAYCAFGAKILRHFVPQNDMNS